MPAHKFKIDVRAWNDTRRKIAEIEANDEREALRNWLSERLPDGAWDWTGDGQVTIARPCGYQSAVSFRTESYKRLGKLQVEDAHVWEEPCDEHEHDLAGTYYAYRDRWL